MEGSDDMIVPKSCWWRIIRRLRSTSGWGFRLRGRPDQNSTDDCFALHRRRLRLFAMPSLNYAWSHWSANLENLTKLIPQAQPGLGSRG